MATVQHAANTRKSESPVPLTGFFNFESRNEVDQYNQDAYNILIHLNLQIVTVLKSITGILSRLVREKHIGETDIDSVLEAINKLSLGNNIRRDSEPKPYVHWKGTDE